MTLKRKFGVTAIALLAVSVVCWFTVGNFRSLVYFALRGTYLAVHPVPPLCKARAAEFMTKVELIQRDAKSSLKVGARKGDVVRFFASENVPLPFDNAGRGYEATGTLYFKGLAACESLACGDDSALIGLRVKVDADGTVLSDPVVIGMSTNCL